MQRLIKICGLSEPETLNAAIAYGATHVGFVFYPPSPRHLSLEAATALRSLIPGNVQLVAVTVNPDDALLADIMTQVQPDYIQLHDAETPERLANIRKIHNVKIIKALAVQTKSDITKASEFNNVADMLLFDAKSTTLPGGTGMTFDWTLLAGVKPALPWFLSGGLNAENVQEALRITHAPAVDVSSGVESRRGVKHVGKIHAFIDAVRELEA